MSHSQNPGDGPLPDEVWAAYGSLSHGSGAAGLPPGNSSSIREQAAAMKQWAKSCLVLVVVIGGCGCWLLASWHNTGLAWPIGVYSALAATGNAAGGYCAEKGRRLAGLVAGGTAGGAGLGVAAFVRSRAKAFRMPASWRECVPYLLPTPYYQESPLALDFTFLVKRMSHPTTSDHVCLSLTTLPVKRMSHRDPKQRTCLNHSQNT